MILLIASRQVNLYINQVRSLPINDLVLNPRAWVIDFGAINFKTVGLSSTL